jgi:hypothetical protein
MLTKKIHWPSSSWLFACLCNGSRFPIRCKKAKIIRENVTNRRSDKPLTTSACLSSQCGVTYLIFLKCSLHISVTPRVFFVRQYLRELFVFTSFFFSNDFYFRRRSFKSTLNINI